MVKQYGGGIETGRATGTDGGAKGLPLPAIGAAPQAGGRRRRRGSKRSGSKRRSQRRSRGKKGGDGGIISTAAVPFGLLALQRYFKGSKTSKQGVARMGKSFKRTFRRRR